VIICVVIVIAYKLILVNIAKYSSRPFLVAVLMSSYSLIICMDTNNKVETEKHV